MPSTSQLTGVAERLLDDKDVHDHIANAVSSLRAVKARADRKGVKAAQDKKTYARLREGVTSILVAVRLVKAKPEPKHRGRKLLLVAAGVGGLAYAGSRLRPTQDDHQEQ